MQTAFFALLLLMNQPAPFITGVYLDADLNVHLKDNSGREVLPPREDGQVSCSAPAVADDRQTVGWLVEDANDTTSYPIPLTLIVYRSGKIIRKLGNGFAIGNWYFLEGGKHVAFNTNTVHGDLAPYYELRDVETNRIVAKWEGPLSARSPSWAKRLSER